MWQQHFVQALASRWCIGGMGLVYIYQIKRRQIPQECDLNAAVRISSAKLFLRALLYLRQRQFHTP
jgi:hypothetical protein